MTLTKDNIKYLHSIYYNLEHVAGFSTLNVLYKYVREHSGKSNLSRDDVAQFLQKQEVYTTHLSKHRPKHWNKIIIPFEKYMYDFDTAHFNVGDAKYKYFVLGIDGYTRKMEARAVENMKAETVSKAVKDIIDTLGVPMKMRVDRGKEYVNSTMNKLLKDMNIDVVYSYAPRKSQLAERAIRTVKSGLFKRMQHNGNKNWSKFLPLVVKNYNNKQHRSIGMAPNSVNKTNEAALWFKNKHDAFDKQPPPTKYKFNINDTVRLKLPKELYSKDFDEKFSSQVYYIASRHSPQNVNRYKVKNVQNELLPSSYSEQELVKVIVDENTQYRVEKILRKKLMHGIPHVYVKWLGYSRQFNSWIPATDLEELSK